MKPESLVELVRGGDANAVEEAWMRLIDASDLEPEHLAEYDVVLTELCNIERASHAEELAWTAIETISADRTPREALGVAGPFLLAVGESEELRSQAAALYRSAYPDVENLEGLLAEAGLEGGRPVRRALRTLDVCLAVQEGNFLVARDDDGAARIEKIDRGDWQFAITATTAAETLGAVHLADRYRSAEPSEFRVMRVFARDRLTRQLWGDPASIVFDICRLRPDGIDTDRLETLLVPDLLSQADWKKWWTRTRAVLRKCPNIDIDGRSPATLTYIETPVVLEGPLIEEFERIDDPLARWKLIDQYVKECRVRGQPPAPTALRRCYEGLAKRATEFAPHDKGRAAFAWVVAVRVGRMVEHDSIPDDALSLFRTGPDLETLVAACDDEALFDIACDCVDQSGRDDWPDQLLGLIPSLPLSVCDRAVARLVSAGRSRGDFEPVVQQITSSPMECFEALLWLWSGPASERNLPMPAPVTLLSRILRTLDDCRRSETISKDAAKKMTARARAVLSARKYERFDRCLEELEAGMAAALRTQISQLDNLGRVVREDLLNRLSRRHPVAKTGQAVPPWACEDVLFVTEAGLAHKQEEIIHHVNVKMRENARAIGRAAEHGDLSENAEYKFALEERDLLRARLAQMNAEVAMARVFTPAEVPTDHIGIGTRVLFERITDGEPYEMSLLGPWEADLQNGKFNYRSPLARKVLGKTVGETIEFAHTGADGTYRIVSLHNALAAPD